MPDNKPARVPCAILLSAALATALLPACGKKETAPAVKPPVDVTVVTVAPRDVPAVFEYVAQTQSSRQVNIQARVSGFLDKRVYTEGKYGQVSKMNVEQARSQYETAAAQIPVIKNQIAQTENALSVLLGRNPGPIARGKKLDALTLSAVPAGSPSTLLERRPDLMQAEQTLIAANAQIGAAKAQYFPTISLTGALGSASTQLNDLFKGPSGVWSYGGSIIGPIFTGGAIAGQVAQAEGAQKAALASYELAIQNAFADVENALASNANLSEQLAAQGRLVKALSEYARLARLQFNGGYTSYTTVLQAEQQLFPSELNLASIRAQLYGSLVNIYKALGGRWVDKADELAPQPMVGSLPPEDPSPSGTPTR
jgi:multidrug efflux system outer membrane protein